MSTHEQQKQTGLIAFFANNPVAANLLMWFIIIIGIFTYSTIQRQMFPNVEINYITVSANYPGASPQEIEESILIKVEESLQDVTDIEEAVYRASHGSGSAQLKIDPDVELTDVLDKVKLRVDSIATFPAAMEPLTVSQIEFRQDVVGMTVSADLPLTQLKPIAKEIEDELLHLGNVSLVSVDVPLDEIAIEIKPDVLRQYNLTIADIANSIRNYSANISAGELRTEAGIISVRVENQSYSGNEFRQLPIKVGANGAQVLLKDVAFIKDEFTEGERYFKLNGKNAVYIQVKATTEQNMVPVANSVNAYIKQKNEQLPVGVTIESLVDMTYYLNGRLSMMKTNLLQGMFLVALMLFVFLRFKLAMWVTIGIPVCFLGAIMLMPALGITLNVTSLFAFIMVLGIVVDDAIVIGESAYTEVEKKGPGVENVIRGAKRVATPATFGVLTTMAVFAPLMFSTGPESSNFISIAGVVLLCLFFSLIESKLILPAHIAQIKFKPLAEKSWRNGFNRRFFGFVNGPYKRFVTRCVEWRWTVLFSFISIFIISISLMTSGHIRTLFLPKIPHDFPAIKLTMNNNVSDDQTIAAAKLLEQLVIDIDQQVEQEYGVKMVKNVMVFNMDRTSAQVMAPLVDEELRPFDTFELSRRWRENMPEIAGVKSILVEDEVINLGDDGDFGYLLYGSDIETLNAAGRQLITLLQQESGLFDISSTIDPASKEIQLSLKPVAYDLGLTLRDIGSQVGASFYGGEAQRVIRNGEEVRVMVRYPKLTREAYSSLKHTVITTPQGKEVVLGDVVDLIEKPGISYIRREEGYRTVYVYGNIDEEAIEPTAVTKRIDEVILPELLKSFPTVKTKLSGAVEEQQAQANEQIVFFVIGMLMVYILLAIPLKSYAQPLIVMSVIPFSLVGALWGHLAFGLDLSLMSAYGIIAAAGVVINDSLVMTDFVNQVRRQGMALKEAVIEAGCARFRAITLTSITTFMGVLPIMFETSLQAMFVIPMAVSLGFAVVFATLITLLLVPCLYIILTDIQGASSKVFGFTTKVFYTIKPRSSKV
ncbi:efflux RND transporter permease subunit [Pseudoalteromonas aurantia]|uniref:Acriflavin resistance protein n=2 Tax=Pseudoalteromonas TaxID=53246 RepID=A0A5S3VAR0_9GAMM|nr:efflux RND transporter permease subunit [Pseudoalteromonas aurantia]TMO61615.1 acriflavin resistance protein [Pseudoalteromonas aurantia]TMO69042.1 acriflavin resistance protein [Pseudoalteromonas aurantia]TMO78660.1 acriflavin resistance protein [Pseudoalteromonas aurantia]